MRSLIRFFIFGPGVILSIILVGLGICWIITQTRSKREAEAKKHQVQRPLGNINPFDVVDSSLAAKSKLLVNRQLIPVNKTEAMPLAVAPVFVPQPALLPESPTPSPTPTPTPEPSPPEVVRKVPKIWAPPGIFIPCALVNTIESSHINTPVVGEVIREVWQNGNLIIPAGTVVSSFAQSGAVRDRIEVAGKWLFVFPDGRQLRVNGIACDREADPNNGHFGVEDGTAGLQGELIESDHWSNAKAFIALLITAASQTGTAVATATLQAPNTTGVTGLPDTTPILAKYLDQLLNGQTGDGRFVRVRSAKEFYVVTTEVIYPTRRTIADEPRNDEDESRPRYRVPNNQEDLSEAVRRQMQIDTGTQPKNEAEPRFRY